MESKKESKVKYLEGNEVRILRGILEDADEYVILHRRDGNKRVYKQFLISIDDEEADQ